MMSLWRLSPKSMTADHSALRHVEPAMCEAKRGGEGGGGMPGLSLGQGAEAPRAGGGVLTLGAPVGVQEDVGGLEVTVDDGGVQVRQALRDVAPQAKDLEVAQRRGAAAGGTGRGMTQDAGIGMPGARATSRR